MRNGEGKISHSKSDSYHGGKKKDMKKFKCFHYHKMGHFATNCPLKKSKEKYSGGATSEALIQIGFFPHCMHGVFNDGKCLVLR